MARRKRVLDDGDDSDSSMNSDSNPIDLDNDPDAREERALFENPYRQKRRRKNGKEEALYGIFADDSDDEDVATSRKKSDWTKAPAFITGDKKVDLEKDMEVDGDGSNEDVDGEDDGLEGEAGTDEDVGESDDSASPRPPSPRVRELDEDEEQQDMDKPRIGGIGSSQRISPVTNRAGLGSGGFSSGGVQTTSSAEADDGKRAINMEESVEDAPSAFASRSHRFQRETNPTPKPSLSAAELAHFNKIQGSFGARMLSKMGWQAGSGLGTTGEGIVTPVESKLRPQKMGIAFKGYKEKTEQSKREAKRRGEVVSDDENEKTKKFRNKVKEQEQKRSDVWKRPKKLKTKIEHKTYEQIIAEAGYEAPNVGIGQIIDATGAVPREVSSLADVNLNSWAPSNDPTRIPEIRHNVRLIAEACKSDLDGLAREAKSLDERKKFVTVEDARLRQKIKEEAELILRLQQIQLVANEMNSLSKDLASKYEASLDSFSPHIYKLVDQFSGEYEVYRLDEIVVAAIAPLMRRMTASWNPLEEPAAFITTFRSWRRALKVNTEEDNSKQTQVDIYGSRSVAAAHVEIEKQMTPFESLLWNVWLPKVRTAINNDWAPESPNPAIKLYESWSSFLPLFIRDNLLDQLILPKVQLSVANWNPTRSNVSLQAIVFPWLPHVGLRLEDVVGDAKRKIKSLLRTWTVEEERPRDLSVWRDVFGKQDWDAMVLKYVVPKLGAHLRADFRINPRDQKMEPLQRVLEWSDIIRPSIFSQILESEFFPKWLDILHTWLVQPRVSFDEVAQWYTFWKGAFPTSIQDLSGVSRGFTRGLQLMNDAIELGPKAPTHLSRPDFRAELSSLNSPSPANGKVSRQPPKPSARTQEITFRSIVEEYASSHNLLLIPTGRAHELSRMPLYKVSLSADAKKGLLIYILDDAIWAPNANTPGSDSDYIAISLEDMVLRASSA